MFEIGDVILYKNGPNLISKFIRLIEGNPFTHCAIVVESDKMDPLLLEIANTFSRVRFVRLSDTLSYTDMIAVARNPDLKVSNNFKLSIIGLDLIESKYSFRSILNCAINHLIGRILGFMDIPWHYREILPIDKNKFTCSALVSFVLDRLTNYSCFDPWTTEPDDFTVIPWKMERIQ
jgi:hypothetical protein